MATTSLPGLKQKCAAACEEFLAAAAQTQGLLADVDLPISQDLRGSLLQHLQVEHAAQEKYRAARQELFRFVQQHFRHP